MSPAAALPLAAFIGLAFGLLVYFTEEWFPRDSAQPLPGVSQAGLLFLLLGSALLMEGSLQSLLVPGIIASGLSFWATVRTSQDRRTVVARTAAILLALGLYAGLPLPMRAPAGHIALVAGLAAFAWGNWRSPQPRLAMFFIPVGIVFSQNKPVGYYLLAFWLCTVVPLIIRRLSRRA